MKKHQLTMQQVLDNLIALQRIRQESTDPELHHREREAALEHFNTSFDFLVNEVRDTLAAEAI